MEFFLSIFELNDENICAGFFCRGMSICMTLMFSRLGSVVGAIVIGYLLDDRCEYTFYMSGLSLIGKQIAKFKWRLNCWKKMIRLNSSPL